MRKGETGVMRRNLVARILAVAALIVSGSVALLGGGGSPAAAASSATAKCPWMDRHLSPEVRARMVVRHMTLTQKVSLLYGRGDITHFGAANYIPGIPALCVPDQVSNDAGAGLGDVQVLVTAFPDGIAQAASWDRSMQFKVGAAIGWEAWHKGIDVQLAPGVDIARNPLNGRTFEYAGEDPYLAGQVGVAEIRGIQSQHVAATVKHYAMNDQETNRMTDSSDVDVRTMQEIHLPAYEAAVKQGHVAAVMCAYNRINGVYACENKYLLRTVLDKQFGFKGWVMSDWGGTHSTVLAAKNGLDQEQNITPGTYFSKALMTAVQNHQVPMATLNEMVTRVMRGLIGAGVFDDPPPSAPRAFTADVNTPQEREVALDAAEGGAVLLKNSRAALPLRGTGQTIALIGPPVTPVGAQQYYQGGGSSKVPLFGVNPNVVDPLSAIAARAQADGDVVIPAPGAVIADAVAAAKLAKTAVVFIGDGEAEGSDRKSLNAVNSICTLVCLPSTGPDQNALVSAVAKANPNTIVVVEAGGPVAMPWLKQVRGVLDLWYPGEQGGNAAAALLFGDANPSGKLPITFPKSMKQTPLRSAQQFPGVTIQGVPHSRYTERLLVGYRWYTAKHITPLFPFGFGLSYTRFKLSHLTVDRTSRGATARFAVTNVGHRAGAEVAQLYVGDPPAAHEPPIQLKGYQKVFLQPGERQWVTLHLNRRAFSYWNTKANGWRVAPGCYGISVGDSSAHRPLRDRICLRNGD